MPTEDRRALTAVCVAAPSGYVLRVIGDGDCQPLAEKELPDWPDWPEFPPAAAHAAGCELVMLGYMIWPDTVTSDSLIGWRRVPDKQAWSATIGSFQDLQAHGN
ncbi:hypothetical protein AB0J01_38065 [Streptomyces sp. NPDC050204]|uniref:hypothetical protein n=1 Tax=Streptomyces sp. NPDC050204 TaxID=3155514 RepID=UPI00342BAE88